MWLLENEPMIGASGFYDLGFPPVVRHRVSHFFATKSLWRPSSPFAFNTSVPEKCCRPGNGLTGTDSMQSVDPRKSTCDCPEGADLDRSDSELLYLSIRI